MRLKPIYPHWKNGDPFLDELRFCAAHEYCRLEGTRPIPEILDELKARRREAAIRRMSRKREVKKSP